MSSPLRGRIVFDTWWPLAASWMLMGLELPFASAVMARLHDPKVSLAAYGGVVFPLALLIESPVIMLLAASTALTRDRHSYRLGLRIALALGVVFTALHALVAFSPLYDVLARRVLGLPEEVVEPARLGLRIMTPWTISIAYRRFLNGVLIRFGESRVVGIGTAVRLGTLGLVATAGAAAGLVGIAVGTAAVASGVVAEAIYAGFRVRPVLRGPLAQAPPQSPPLTVSRFAHFYVPLMITPLFLFLGMPLTSAAMSRMPRALDSLAVWPVLTGLVFTLRSVGFALNEVVVALLDRPGAYRALRRFVQIVATVTSALLVITAVTPLAALWFGRVSALPPSLVALGKSGLLLGWPLPALSALASLYQGLLLHAHRTRPITESVIAYLAVSVTILAIAVAWGRFEGVGPALVAMTSACLAQVAWLRFRSRDIVRAHIAADAAADAVALQPSAV